LDETVVTAPQFCSPSVIFVSFFRVSIIQCTFVILLVSPVIVRLRNVSYFRVYFFISCLCSLECFSRRNRHTNLVSLVIFLSFLLALFVFRFGFLAALYI